MKVAILRAVGDGGYQDARTGHYVSSQVDSVVPYSDWAESLVNHDRIRVIEVLEGSDWGEYVNHLAEAGGEEDAALASYRKVLPGPKNKVEKVKVVENAADAQRQEDEQKEARTPAKAPVATKDAPAAKSAE